MFFFSTISMKKYWIALCICLPLAVWAQPQAGLRAAKALSTRQVTNAMLRSTPRTAWISLKKNNTLLQLISHTTPPAKIPQLHKNIVLSAPQRQEWLQHYQKILTDFEQFKKESSTFLFIRLSPWKCIRYLPKKSAGGLPACARYTAEF